MPPYKTSHSGLSVDSLPPLTRPFVLHLMRPYVETTPGKEFQLNGT